MFAFGGVALVANPSTDGFEILVLVGLDFGGEGSLYAVFFETTCLYKLVGAVVVVGDDEIGRAHV